LTEYDIKIFGVVNPNRKKSDSTGVFEMALLDVDGVTALEIDKNI